MLRICYDSEKMWTLSMGMHPITMRGLGILMRSQN